LTEYWKFFLRVSSDVFFLFFPFLLQFTWLFSLLLKLGFESNIDANSALFLSWKQSL